MIKEIRIGLDDVIHTDFSVMEILKEKGFPVEGYIILKPKAGLKYFEFHDYKTDEIVIQWEED